MTHEVQASLEKAKKALFFLNEALCQLSTSKPNDILANQHDPRNPVEPYDTLREFYRRINLCIDDASSIRDHFLTLEIYNLTFPPKSSPRPPSNPSVSPASIPTIKHSLPPDPEDFDDDDSINPLPNDLMEPPDTQPNTERIFSELRDFYNTDDSDEKGVE